MEFASIASGSSGNCLYIGNDDTHILIDAGISKKRIEAGLSEFCVDPKDIDGLFVTHEHSDHIQGIGVLSRKYHIPIYATRGTLIEIKKSAKLGVVDESLFHVIRPGEDICLKNMKISPFSMPHDARDPVSYYVSDSRHKVGTATDLGYYDESIVNALKASDILYIEANHDMNMLLTGSYPYALKMRVAGNYGHLCNEKSGQLIGRLLNERLHKVVLGHLSKENNYPQLALEAVRCELIQSYDAGDTDIEVAPRDHALKLIRI